MINPNSNPILFRMNWTDRRSSIVEIKKKEKKDEH